MNTKRPNEGPPSALRAALMSVSILGLLVVGIVLLIFPLFAVVSSPRLTDFLVLGLPGIVFVFYIVGVRQRWSRHMMLPAGLVIQLCWVPLIATAAEHLEALAISVSVAILSFWIFLLYALKLPATRG